MPTIYNKCTWACRPYPSTPATRRRDLAAPRGTLPTPTSTTQAAPGAPNTWAHHLPTILIIRDLDWVEPGVCLTTRQTSFARHIGVRQLGGASSYTLCPPCYGQLARDAPNAWIDRLHALLEGDEYESRVPLTTRQTSLARYIGGRQLGGAPSYTLCPPCLLRAAIA